MSNLKKNVVADEAREATELKSFAAELNFEYVKAAEIGEAVKENTTSLQNFYKDQSIFVTGGTGFLGRLLIRRLLLICPEIDCIYVLIRPNEQDVDDREDDLIYDQVLDDIDFKDIEMRRKLVAMEGDCTEANLGLNREDQELIIDTVSIIFHVAGTSPTEQDLLKATELNCGSTYEIIDLCKKMKLLRSLVYVSSANAQFTSSNIEERFYPHTWNYSSFAGFLASENREIYEEDSTSLISPWPNAHLFTKAMAENVIAEHSGSLPLGIFRPGLLGPSCEEPKVGWCDRDDRSCLLAGLVSRTMRGHLRILVAEGWAHTNIVPVDLAANALIACAHDLALRHDATRENNEHVYNYVSTVEAPLAWKELRSQIVRRVNDCPYSKSIGHCNLALTSYESFCELRNKFQYQLAAILYDFISFMDLRETGTASDYREGENFARDFAVYSSSHWNYSSDNTKRMWDQMMPEEQKICKFNMLKFDWQKYLADVVINVRENLLHDPSWTMVEARRRSRTLRQVQTMLKLLVFITFYYTFKHVFYSFVNLKK